MNGDRRAIEATVSGLVQGVGFRWFVRREADGLGVAGWVANLPDGSVQVVAEGPDAAVEALLDALREGPPGAWVKGVAVVDRPPSGSMDSFEIRVGHHRGD